MEFEFCTPTRVIFGRGSEGRVGEIVSSYGYRRVLFVYGGGSVKKSGLYDRVCESLASNGISFSELSGVKPNPVLSLAKRGMALARETGAELILAVGGGSVIDTAKEIAIGALDGGEHWDFALGKRTPERALPVGVVLTISAAGSEMSSSAVLTNEEDGSKRGYNTPLHRPLFAICNPELTFTVDKYQTASGIVDILMHTLERYFAPVPDTEITDAIALALCREVVKAGRIAYENPQNYEARASLMWASSLSHNDLTGAGRFFAGTCHRLEHEMSAKYDVAHGAGLAVVFPAFAKYVYRLAPERFARFAREVFAVTLADDLVAAEQGIEILSSYFRSIGMPLTFGELGIPDPDILDMARRCSRDKTISLPSYIKIGYDEMLDIYRLML
ncbi:MAG: iron-containing alcohol dehydrogenase [Clostridia bacterium]|nr:iron-containing alcohol dehydrogenase [Clostridia bacterium]